MTVKVSSSIMSVPIQCSTDQAIYLRGRNMAACANFGAECNALRISMSTTLHCGATRVQSLGKKYIKRVKALVCEVVCTSRQIRKSRIPFPVKTILTVIYPKSQTLLNGKVYASVMRFRLMFKFCHLQKSIVVIRLALYGCFHPMYQA